MADLGTSVTYLDPQKTGKPVRIQGVYFQPNEATELTDFMPQGKAERLAEQLSKNRHFQVEGGPDLSSELEDLAAARFEQEQRAQQVYRDKQAARQPLNDAELNGTAEPPASYTPPEAPALEGENMPRTNPDDEVPTPTRRAKSK